MRPIFKISALLLFIFILLPSCSGKPTPKKVVERAYVTEILLGIKGNKVSPEWIMALETRQRREYLDSLSKVERPVSDDELAWKALIVSKKDHWDQMKDSLKIPFEGIHPNDTTYVLVGYQGHDDAFTYGDRTICFDLTALHRSYGHAKDSINSERMDRLFAHEYTHLLSKSWVAANGLQLKNYRDSIFWECMYEGFGMYRSMSEKWFPKGDSLSPASSRAFEGLYPKFVDRIIAIDSSPDLSDSLKSALHKNLSRGSMDQKWGALPVAVWLAMEAKGDDKKLSKWVNMGPEALIPLAKKYLKGKNGDIFAKYLSDQMSIPTPDRTF